MTFDFSLHPVNEKSSALVSIICWGIEVPFGNLIRSNGSNSLHVYTVNIENRIYAFSAQALLVKIPSKAKHFKWSPDVDNSIQQAASIVKDSFKSYTEFKQWIKLNGHPL